MTTRTETALSVRTLAIIETEHQAVMVGATRATFDYCAADGQNWPCDARFLLAALTAERAARGQVEAALTNVRTYAHARYPSDDPGWQSIVALCDVALLSPSTTTPEATE